MFESAMKNPRKPENKVPDTGRQKSANCDRLERATRNSVVSLFFGVFLAMPFQTVSFVVWFLSCWQRRSQTVSFSV